ncbi:ABC transporter ATP-binding protein [Pseudoflavonifractor capillosus]|uniref:ABC transporter ATP-binding protein n=1 Tax=Pseudoflavonifractor capillosus TaxID=106588 RepID=UPI001FAFF030|nr:ABC transporter ATP-binding protein [Pseudoflavonifractor capillosus]
MDMNVSMEQENREVALSVKNVSITYRTVRPLAFLDCFRKGAAKKKKKDFQAVKDVSFDVYKGEIVGLIGKNGSGKSTLLRSVANIYKPDSGTIDCYGQSVALMAIGVGFVNELSGRDNIYLSAMLMGYTKQQIDEKIDEIINFAEIGDFIDEPVRSYSSGMHSKLAFSITAVMEADIMLVDETLSVGDTRFKKKSSRKMKELIHDESKTVLIVSHSTSTLQELCQRVIWLDQGRVRMIGDTETVLDAYQQSIAMPGE